MPAVLFLLMASHCVSASIFDETITWRYDLPGGSSNASSLEPSELCDKEFEALFLHTKPYEISSLSWNYAMMRYGFGRWGVFGNFGHFGLDRYYARNEYEIGTALSFADYLAGSAAAVYRNEDFQDVGNFNRSDLKLKLSYCTRRFTGTFGISRINLKKPYDFPDIDRPQPSASASYRFGDDLMFSVAIRRFDNEKTRWLFNQFISISREIDLNFGYINRPGVIYGELGLSVKSLRLILSYHSVSRLKDTVVFGLGFGR